MELSEWHAWFKHQGGRELRELLLAEWDPIGVAGSLGEHDEYAGYIGRIADMLRSKASLVEIAVYLASATDHMGLIRNDDRDRRVAHALHDWYAHAGPASPEIDAVDDRWRFVSIVSEGQVTDVGGVNPWSVHWHPIGGHVVVAHPRYPAQRHVMDTYVVAGSNPPVVFAAGEFSNGAWGFYVPKDRRTVMTAGGQLKVAADRWSASGEKINSPENLATIKAVLDESGPIIVEWWHLRGASAPDRLFFDEYDRFAEWLESRPPGDLVYVWDFAKVCLDDNRIARGKYPDELGEIPAGGPY